RDGVRVVVHLSVVDGVERVARVAGGALALGVARDHHRVAHGHVPLVGRAGGGVEVVGVAALGVVPDDGLGLAVAVRQRALLVEGVAAAAEAHCLALVLGAVLVLVAVRVGAGGGGGRGVAGDGPLALLGVRVEVAVLPQV